MIINFTGSVVIDDSVYKDLAIEEEQDWEEMSTQERIAFVKRVEKDAGNEFFDEVTAKDIEVTLVETE